MGRYRGIGMPRARKTKVEKPQEANAGECSPAGELPAPVSPPRDAQKPPVAPPSPLSPGKKRVQALHDELSEATANWNYVESLLKPKEKDFKKKKACFEAKRKGLAARRPTKSVSALDKRAWDSQTLSLQEAHAEHYILGYRLLSADCLLAACGKKLAWKDAEIARLKRLLRRATGANGSTCVRRKNSG